MTSQSDLNFLTPKERRDYGFARVRDAAFDAVCSLWARRQAEADLASAIDADAGWVSKNLRGPGNWTMRTFGAFVEALRGEAQISIRALEDPLPRTNYHAYVEYEPAVTGIDKFSPPKELLTSAHTSPKDGPNRPLITTLTP